MKRTILLHFASALAIALVSAAVSVAQDVEGFRQLDIAAKYALDDDHRRAIDAATTALKIFEKRVGADDVLIADVLSRIAFSHNMLREHTQAERLLTRAVRILNKQKRPDSAVIHHVYSELVFTYTGSGNNAGLETSLKRLISLHKRNNGPSLVLFLEQLATLYAVSGRLEDAEPHARRAIGIAEHLSPRKATTLGRLYTALGSALMKRGLLDSAETCLSRAVELHREAQPRDSFGLVSALNGLATLMILTERYDAAIPLAEEGLKILETAAPKARASIKRSMEVLANLYERAGRTTEAHDLRARAEALAD